MQPDTQFADAIYKERYFLSRIGAITAMTLIQAPPDTRDLGRVSRLKC